MGGGGGGGGGSKVFHFRVDPFLVRKKRKERFASPESIHLPAGNGYISWEITLSELFCLLSQKRFTVKRKNLLSLGANSPLLE